MVEVYCWYSFYIEAWLRWPITATAITKGNTINKEILINEKNLLTYKKDLHSIKNDLFTKKRIFSHRKKVFLHKQNKPTANSHVKFSWQIAMPNSDGKFPEKIPTTYRYGKFPRQKNMANPHGKKPRWIPTANSHYKYMRMSNNNATFNTSCHKKKSHVLRFNLR